MFRQVFLWFLQAFLSVCNTLRSFILDETFGITFFHFLIFSIFFKLVLHLISFIKQIQEMQEEGQRDFERSEKQRYDNWLRSHVQTKRR